MAPMTAAMHSQSFKFTIQHYFVLNKDDCYKKKIDFK